MTTAFTMPSARQNSERGSETGCAASCVGLLMSVEQQMIQKRYSLIESIGNLRAFIKSFSPSSIVVPDYPVPCSEKLEIRTRLLYAGVDLILSREVMPKTTGLDKPLIANRLKSLNSNDAG